jgi:hypothetical protein
MNEQLKAPAERVQTNTGRWFSQRPRLRLGAVVALAAAAGVIAWAVIGGGGHGGSSNTASGTSSRAAGNGLGLGPVGLSAEGLRAQSKDLRQQIYWAGPKPGYTYELTRTATGRVFVRYLPPGKTVGAKGSDYLIIATYRFTKPFRALKALAARNGGGFKLQDGGFVYVGPRAGKSVYVAYPGVPYEIEVYAPSPARARSVARSGDVRPVG